MVNLLPGLRQHAEYFGVEVGDDVNVGRVWTQDLTGKKVATLQDLNRLGCIAMTWPAAD